MAAAIQCRQQSRTLSCFILLFSPVCMHVYKKSSELTEVLQRVVQPSPAGRPSTQQLLNYQYFKSPPPAAAVDTEHCEWVVIVTEKHTSTVSLPQAYVC